MGKSTTEHWCEKRTFFFAAAFFAGAFFAGGAGAGGGAAAAAALMRELWRVGAASGSAFLRGGILRVAGDGGGREQGVEQAV